MSQIHPLAISMGEPAGIGPDLILQLYAQRVELELPAFVVFGNVSLLAARAEQLGLNIELSEPLASGVVDDFPRRLPVVDVGDQINNTPGNPVGDTAQMVIESISSGVSAVLTGACRGLVTAPIHKAVLKRDGFEHPGHTEFLADLCKANGKVPTPVMMLAHAGLRVVPLTIHVPLSTVPDLVTTERIVEQVRIVHRDLVTRMGIADPRIAVTGLNPHAGEEGEIGREDMERIVPAVAELQKLGINVTGPLPADTAFHLPKWKSFDVVVAMYHDQALIPIKTVAFDEAVNITLGLPIVRTSPDHGTAFDLAGTGKASQKSMLAAIRMADRMSDFASVVDA